MNSRLDALNRWLGIVSNLGVIGGFVLLAVQMSENTRALQIESTRTIARELQPTDIALMGDDAAAAYMTALRRPADLTEMQFLQLWSYVSAGIGPTHSAWVAWKNGDASEESWILARNWGVGLINFRAGRVMWPMIAPTYPPEFTAAIDRELAREQWEPWDTAATRTFDEVWKLPPLELANRTASDSEIAQ